MLLFIAKNLISQQFLKLIFIMFFFVNLHLDSLDLLSTIYSLIELPIIVGSIVILWLKKREFFWILLKDKLNKLLLLVCVL